MRSIVTGVGVALAISLASGAAAYSSEPAGEAAAAEAKSDKSKKICRTIVKSGTRFSTRICRSKEAWDKDAEAAARYLEDGQMNHSRRNDGITNVP